MPSGILAELRANLHLLPAPLAMDLRRALDTYDAGVDLMAALSNGDHHRGRSALRRAAELLDPSGGTWHRAGVLAAAVKRVSARNWKPRTAAEQMIGMALECGPVPMTQRRLYEAIRD